MTTLSPPYTVTSHRGSGDRGTALPAQLWRGIYWGARYTVGETLLLWKESVLSSLPVCGSLGLSDTQRNPAILGKLPCLTERGQRTAWEGRGPRSWQSLHLQRHDLVRAVRDYRVANPLASARLSWMGRCVRLPLASCFLEPAQRELFWDIFGSNIWLLQDENSGPWVCYFCSFLLCFFFLPHLTRCHSHPGLLSPAVPLPVAGPAPSAVSHRSAPVREANTCSYKSRMNGHRKPQPVNQGLQANSWSLWARQI